MCSKAFTAICSVELGREQCSLCTMPFPGYMNDQGTDKLLTQLLF